ncbi:hypothetical protein NEAUS04_1277 [Nematocida ausubeli]|nr:hypothetical protein NEAUS04_1277 [Nematocida ausubeli]
MAKDIHLLLKETKKLLERKDPEDKDDIHSQLVGLYLYLQEYNEEDRESLVAAYNELVDRGLSAGISKLKKIIKKASEVVKIKKREEPEENAETQKLTASILDHSKTLKKKAESFGQMLENSKSFVENVSAGVRENVKQVEKGVHAMDSKEWYNLSTSQLVFLLGIVLLIFILMYVVIRMV